MISVVMCTYNGAEYIIEQLDSIRMQSRRPDEVIIQDDVSQDDTCTIVKNYICQHNLTNWTLVENKRNLGWKRNFYDAICRATGDFIFFSDQDDVWNLSKIEIMSNVMNESDFDVVISEYDYIDSHGKELGKRKKETNRVVSVKPSTRTLQDGTLGCCMCISRRIQTFYINFGGNQPGSHDYNCYMMGLLYSKVAKVDICLIHHRLHGKNATIQSLKQKGNLDKEIRIQDIQELECFFRLLQTNYPDIDEKKYLEKTIRFLGFRIKYLQNEIGFFKMFSQLRHYPRKSTIIMDFAYRHDINKKIGALYSIFFSSVLFLA